VRAEKPGVCHITCMLFLASDAPRERRLHVRLQTSREHIAVGEIGTVGNQKRMARPLGERLHGNKNKIHTH